MRFGKENSRLLHTSTRAHTHARDTHTGTSPSRASSARTQGSRDGEGQCVNRHEASRTGSCRRVGKTMAGSSA